MAKDYKREARAAAPTRAPGSWLSFMTGLGLGLACAALVWFRAQEPPQPGAQQAPPAAEVAGNPDAPEDTTGREPPPPPSSPVTRPTFDFYTILPEVEVKIPDSEVPAPEPEAAADSAEPPPVATQPDPAAPRFMLQVASFQAAADAEKSKATLALQGVQASVYRVGINGQEWYRVHVGPYADLGQAQQMRSHLEQLGVKAIVLKVSGG